MSKWLWMIVLTGLAVLLASCGASDAPPTVASSATPLLALTANDVQRITPVEARALLDNRLAVLYDARSAGEYRTQHAAGAISFPEADITARHSKLPADKALIFY